MQTNRRPAFLGLFAGVILTLAMDAGAAFPPDTNRSRGPVPMNVPLTDAQVIDRLRAVIPDFRYTGSAQAGCRVLSPGGVPTDSVKIISFGDASYWMKYLAEGAVSQRVDFFLVPLSDASPLTLVKQTFEPGDDSDITTPFGIPEWALDRTTGPWALVVRNDLGQMSICRFTVIP